MKKGVCGKDRNCECVCETMCVSLVWNNIASPGIYFAEHKRIKAVTHVAAAAVKLASWLHLDFFFNDE